MTLKKIVFTAAVAAIGYMGLALGCNNTEKQPTTTAPSTSSTASVDTKLLRSPSGGSRIESSSLQGDICACNGGDKCCCLDGFKCCNTPGRCCCESASTSSASTATAAPTVPPQDALAQMRAAAAAASKSAAPGRITSLQFSLPPANSAGTAAANASSAPSAALAPSEPTGITCKLCGPLSGCCTWDEGKDCCKK